MFGHFASMQYKGAHARVHTQDPTSTRVYAGPSQLGASIIGVQGASGGAGLSVTVQVAPGPVALLWVSKWC